MILHLSATTAGPDQPAFGWTWTMAKHEDAQAVAGKNKNMPRIRVKVAFNEWILNAEL
jgi:hypothetical protein